MEDKKRIDAIRGEIYQETIKVKNLHEGDICAVKRRVPKLHLDMVNLEVMGMGDLRGKS